MLIYLGTYQKKGVHQYYINATDYTTTKFHHIICKILIYRILDENMIYVIS